MYKKQKVYLGSNFGVISGVWSGRLLFLPDNIGVFIFLTKWKKIFLNKWKKVMLLRKKACDALQKMGDIYKM